MKKIEMFTDGACSGNPGPGGWGVLLRYQGHEKELSGFVAETTNNRMELMAAIVGLQALKHACDVVIHTDSKYVLEGATKYLKIWKRNGWKTAAKKEVKNVDLWQALDVVCADHSITWTWVKGHAGHAENERADALARQAIVQNSSKTESERSNIAMEK